MTQGAGVTGGAFYSRYENVYELLLDVWVQRSAQPVREILDLAVSAQTGKVAPDAVAAAISERSDQVIVGLSLFLVAPRMPELAETVLPQVRGWLAQSGEGLIDAIIPVAFTVGALLFDGIVGAPGGDWSTPLQWTQAAGGDGLPKRKARTRDDQVTVDTLVHPNSGDDIRDRLLLAAATVISRGGVARATASRIARVADVPQAVIFEMWGSRANLIADTIAVILQGLSESVAPMGLAAMSGDVEKASAGVSFILSLGYTQPRQLRVELVLAAMSDPLVADAMITADRVATDALTLAAEATSVDLRTLAGAIRAVMLGLVVLQQNIGMLDDLDFHTPIERLLRAAAGTGSE